MGRKVGKFYFMTHLFPTAQLKNRGVEAQGHKFFYIIFYLYVLLNQIRDNHIFTKDWQWLRRRRRGFFFFTESAAVCRVGRVTGNNNNFLLGPMMKKKATHVYMYAIVCNVANLHDEVKIDGWNNIPTVNSRTWDFDPIWSMVPLETLTVSMSCTVVSL